MLTIILLVLLAMLLVQVAKLERDNRSVLLALVLWGIVIILFLLALIFFAVVGIHLYYYGLTDLTERPAFYTCGGILLAFALGFEWLKEQGYLQLT